MNDIQSGKYTSVNKRGKFADYGSIPEDSIYYHTRLAEQADAKRKQENEAMKLR